MPSELTAAQYAEERARLVARPVHGDGPSRRRALAELTDAWVSGLLGQAEGVALVAVGGYGRSELSPGSDLDLLLLHQGRGGSHRSPEVAALADKIWYPIWDSGVRLDHSVRTVDETRRMAAQDLPVLLGLLDARHVAGDPQLTMAVRSAVLADWRAHAARRLPELYATCQERAELHGELAFMLEGDLKEARGGLRDLTILRAVAASWVADAPHDGLADAGQRLLDVRDALHRVTGRSSDRLVLQEHDAVAAELGLMNGDVLLRMVSEAARIVTYAFEVTWRRVNQVLASRRRTLRRPRTGPQGQRSPLAPGVVVQEGEVVLARDAVPSRDPGLLLRTAAAAAQAGLPLSPHAVDRLAAEYVPLPVPWPASAREALVGLLGAGTATITVWEALEQRRLITRLLPDWERVRCRPQRNPVHRFTVDRHLVEAAVRASERTRRVSRPDLLLVGALLHDIGKGWPGDHSVSGEVIARDMATRMGFPEADADVLARLVRHHLLLVDTATRRDLDDPTTIETVARTLGSVEVLELLHALTEADAVATGPVAWNSWRAGLVEELVGRTGAALKGHPIPTVPALDPSQRSLARSGELTVVSESGEHSCAVTVVAPDQLGALALVAGVLSLHRVAVRAATAESVEGMAVQVWTVEPEFGRMPDPAVLREDIRRALEGSLDVAARLTRREEAYAARPHTPKPPPRVEVVPGASESATVIEIRTHDSPGLLHRVGQAFAKAGVDVHRARVSTFGAEALDAFYIVDAEGRSLTSVRAAEVVRALYAVLG
jgi:[protein-PII] uridylyltransferase